MSIFKFQLFPLFFLYLSGSLSNLSPDQLEILNRQFNTKLSLSLGLEKTLPISEIPINILKEEVPLSLDAEKTAMIYWSEDYKLNWDDFGGKPDFQYKDISALTSSGIIHYKGCDENNKIKYKVQAYFEREESWVKKEALTDHHLIHEQIHFDITALYARKLRKVLKEKSFACGQEDNFELFVAGFLENWKNEQRAYDMLSCHSANHEFQKEWYYRIEMELSLLDDFME